LVAITDVKPASSKARIGFDPAPSFARPGRPGIVHALSIAGGAQQATVSRHVGRTRCTDHGPQALEPRRLVAGHDGARE